MAEIDLGPAPKEIDLGPAPAPEPVDHTMFLDRVDRGAELSHMWEAFKGGAEEAYGQGPLGIDPSGETQKWLQDHGVFHDPANAQWGDSLRMGTEAVAKPIAALQDFIGRVVAAGGNGLADALSAAQKDEPKLADMAQSIGAEGDWGDALRHGLGWALSGDAVPLARTKLMPDGRVVDEPVGVPPPAGDFDRIGRLLTDPEAPHLTSWSVVAKLRSLYEEHGIHPSEVLSDAQTDPALRAELNSAGPILPPRYTGVDPAALLRDQVQADTEAGRPSPRRADISPDLNDALTQRTEWPRTPDGVQGPSASTGWSDWIGRQADKIGAVADLQMKVAPMAAKSASVTARATARDFANALRVAKYDWQRLHNALTDEFTPEELGNMWNRADAESVAREAGHPFSSINYPDLPPRQRFVVDRLQAMANDAWEQAKDEDVGLVQPDHPGRTAYGYIPRMVLFNHGASEPGFFNNVLNAIGLNLRTNSKNLLGRKYLTAEETEAAAQEISPDAKLVKDIRTLPLATFRLQNAIAGRRMMNVIQDVGDRTTPEGELNTVYVGHNPGDTHFTIPQNPAFYTWRPQFSKDGRIVRNEDGSVAVDRVPMFVSKDWEGPLRAVLSQKEGAAYKGFMQLKMKSTSAIMFSPMLHNAVIFGRILPSKYGNPIATAKLYTEGHRLLADTDFMREAISNGLAPVGRGGASADLASLTGAPQIPVGRSWTSQVLGYLPNLFSKTAGDIIKGGIDTIGHFVHERMLWDQIRAAQAGIYKDYLDQSVARGFPRDASAKLAAQFANRYAGSIPIEEMGNTSRKIANALLFSRSFTMGTLGSMKDVFTGMPRDVLAQIERDHGVQTMMQMRSFAQKKAFGIMVADMALYYAGGSLLATGWHVLSGAISNGLLQGTSQVVSDEYQDYADRMKAVWNQTDTNPYAAFGMFNAMDATSDNEPGKEHRILLGYQSDGTAVYGKMQVGRTGADMVGYSTRPLQTIMDKMSTFARPALDIAVNQDAMGNQVYKPNPQNAQDYMKNAARIATHFLEAQVPMDSLINPIRDLMNSSSTNDERKLAAEKLFLPLIGVMTSKGYPGGPVQGAIHDIKKSDDFDLKEAMPDIAKAIREDRIDEARDMMDRGGMDKSFQHAYIESVRNPQAKFMKRQIRELYNKQTPQVQERLDRMWEKDNPQ